MAGTEPDSTSESRFISFVPPDPTKPKGDADGLPPPPVYTSPTGEFDRPRKERTDRFDVIAPGGAVEEEVGFGEPQLDAQTPTELPPPMPVAARAPEHTPARLAAIAPSPTLRALHGMPAERPVEFFGRSSPFPSAAPPAQRQISPELQARMQGVRDRLVAEYRANKAKPSPVPPQPSPAELPPSVPPPVAMPTRHSSGLSLEEQNALALQARADYERRHPPTNQPAAIHRTPAPIEGGTDRVTANIQRTSAAGHVQNFFATGESQEGEAAETGGEYDDLPKPNWFRKYLNREKTASPMRLPWSRNKGQVLNEEGFPESSLDTGKRKGFVFFAVMFLLAAGLIALALSTNTKDAQVTKVDKKPKVVATAKPKAGEGVSPKPPQEQPKPAAQEVAKVELPPPPQEAPKLNTPSSPTAPKAEAKPDHPSAAKAPVPGKAEEQRVVEAAPSKPIAATPKNRVVETEPPPATPARERPVASTAPAPVPDVSTRKAASAPKQEKPVRSAQATPTPAAPAFARSTAGKPTASARVDAAPAKAVAGATPVAVLAAATSTIPSAPPASVEPTAGKPAPLLECTGSHVNCSEGLEACLVRVTARYGPAAAKGACTWKCGAPCILPAEVAATAPSVSPSTPTPELTSIVHIGVPCPEGRSACMARITARYGEAAARGKCSLLCSRP